MYWCHYWDEISILLLLGISLVICVKLLFCPIWQWCRASDKNKRASDKCLACSSNGWSNWRSLNESTHSFLLAVAKSTRWLGNTVCNKCPWQYWRDCIWGAWDVQNQCVVAWDSFPSFSCMKCAVLASPVGVMKWKFCFGGCMWCPSGTYVHGVSCHVCCERQHGIHMKCSFVCLVLLLQSSHHQSNHVCANGFDKCIVLCHTCYYLKCRHSGRGLNIASKGCHIVCIQCSTGGRRGGWRKAGNEILWHFPTYNFSLWDP